VVLLALLKIDSHVKEHRLRLNYSQERLARELGVSRQTISNIEKGLSEPGVLLALGIAAILGVAVADLFRRKT